MAILVEAISVVIRADRLLAGFNDDWEGFRELVPNETLCADSELVRVGFMCPADAAAFCRELEPFGLDYLIDGKARDLVVVDQQHGLMAPCDWAMFGHISWQGDPAKRLPACMLAGSTSMQIAVPEGWSWDNSLIRSFGFVPTGNEAHVRLIERRADLDIWRSPLSDKPLYSARIYPATHKHDE